MTKSILKSIVVGSLIGALVFFTGPLLLLIFILKFIFTPFGRMRHGHYGYGGPYGNPRFNGMRLAFADKVRNMSEEDYSAFKSKFENGFMGRHRHC